MAAGASSGLKAVLIAAFISLSVFLCINYVLVPAVRRYRERYEQYLPLHSISGSLIQHTSSLRERIASVLTRFVLPSRYRHVEDGSSRRGSLSNGDDSFGIEEGEGMIGFDVREIDRRREQLRRDVGNMADARRSSAGSGPP
ncbi:hypothetical protein MBLNU459_g3403t1 [Dothideomycetes sp. NU459]